MKLTHCLVHLNRREELIANIKHHAPYVDRCIVSDGDSTDGSLEWLRSEEAKVLNVEVVVEKQYRMPYGNHTPIARNPYLRLAGDKGWILVTDTDEFLEIEACEKLRSFAEKAEASGFDEVRFQAHDIWTYEDGQIYDNLSNYWKQDMFFKAYAGTYYAGHTHSGLAKPGAINRWAKARGKEDRFLQYHHKKTEFMMWRNSSFLYWTTAKNAANVTDDTVWLDFHKIMERYGFVDWHEFNKAMVKGNLPSEITNWFVAHKEDENPEIQAYFIYYYLWLHPEENVDKINCERHSRYTWDYVLKARGLVNV